MPRLDEAQWAEAKSRWENDASLFDAQIGALFGVTKAGVRKRRLADGWQRSGGASEVTQPAVKVSRDTKKPKGNPVPPKQETRKPARQKLAKSGHSGDAESDDPWLRLNRQQRRFVDEYVIDLNGRQAAIRAGYSERSAHSQAHDLLKHPDVAACIQLRLAEREQSVRITQADVLRKLRDVANADVNELVEHRRLCCRFCWGLDFKYQRTAGEMAADEEAYLLRAEEREAKNLRAPAPFDSKGGTGFIRVREPNTECPECCGEGISDVFLKDTRQLSEAARTIYAGAKVGKNGIEMLIVGREGYDDMLSKHTKVYDPAPVVTFNIVPQEALDAAHDRAHAIAAERQQQIKNRQQRLGLRQDLQQDNE